MLTEKEKSKVLSSDGQLKNLDADLKHKLKAAMKEGKSPFKAADGDICCDTGMDAPNRFIKTSAQNCTQLGWTVVDSSNCP
jgi:hypothetical protein